MPKTFQLVLTAFVAGCASTPVVEPLSPYLFVWAYDQDQRPGDRGSIATAQA